MGMYKTIAEKIRKNMPLSKKELNEFKRYGTGDPTTSQLIRDRQRDVGALPGLEPYFQIQSIFINAGQTNLVSGTYTPAANMAVAIPDLLVTNVKFTGDFKNLKAVGGIGIGGNLILQMNGTMQAGWQGTVIFEPNKEIFTIPFGTAGHSRLLQPPYEFTITNNLV